MMNLWEIIATLAIIALAVAVAILPGKNLYSHYRADAYKIASALKSCAIFSIGNEACSTTITGKLLTVTCSSGYKRQELLHKGTAGNYSFTCREGYIENPQNVTVGQFTVEVSRRSVNVHLEKKETQPK